MRRVLVLAAAGLVPVVLSTPALAEVPPYRCGTETRTFTSRPSNGTIRENTTHEFPIEVGGMGPLFDIDVLTDVRSSRSGDLEITLIPPVSTFGPELVLTRGNGGAVADAFARMRWDDQATRDGLGAVTDIDFRSFDGSRLPPQVPLARGLSGTPNGTWTLRIRDLSANGSTAALVSWSLVMTSASTSPFLYTQTNTAQVLTTYPPPAQGTQTATIPIDTTSPFDPRSPARVLEVAVRTQLPHANSGHYDVVVRSPAGTAVTLTSDNGNGIANAFGNVRWSDRAGLPVTLTDLTPPAGMRELAPEQPLGAFIGESIDGTWTLEVTDDTAGTAGAPFSWQLDLTSSHCADIRPSVEGESTSTGARNDTIATALPLTMAGGTVARAFGQVAEAQAGIGADVDHWSFEAPANARVWVLAQARPRSFPAFQGGVRVAVGDVNGAIYDSDQSDGTVLPIGPFGSDRATPSIAGQPLPSAGRHIIRVEPVAGAGEVPYELFVLVSALPPVDVLPSTQPSPLAQYARPVATARGTTADGPDAYRVFQVVPGSLVLVSIDGDPDRTGSTSNPSLTFQDGSAPPVVLNRSSSAPHAEAVVIAPASDTLTITVADGGSSGPYAVTAALIRGPNVDLRLTRQLLHPATVDGLLHAQYASESDAPGQYDALVSLSYTTGVITSPQTTTTPQTVCAASGFLGVSSIQCPFAAAQTSTVDLIGVIPPATASPLVVSASVFPREASQSSGPPAALDYRVEDNVASDPIPLAAPSADLGLVVAPLTADGARPGDTFTVTASVHNFGPSTARAVSLQCVLPALAEFASVTAEGSSVTCVAPSVDPTTGRQAVSCSTASLPVVGRTAAAATLVVRVRPTATGPALAELACTGASATPDPSVHSNSRALTFAVLGPPTATDTDGDGLTNAFEEKWGLDPADPQGSNGAAGDPDNDGIPSLEEQAAGTHPRGTYRRFFAEGATGPFFDTRLAILHPYPRNEAARVQVRYLRPAPLPPVLQDFAIPAQRRYTIDLESIPGLENTAVSFVVESDQTLLADRTMSWDGSGYGSHGETGVSSPGTQWFLAEGSTLGAFNLFYLLQNPNDEETTVTVRYLRPAPLPAIERTYAVGPNARFNIWVNHEGPEFVSTDVSAAITSTRPIIVERAMYLDRPGQQFGAGHAGTGARSLDDQWFLAEGATGPFFDLFVLLANPGDEAADVRLEYLLPDGTVITRTRVLAPNSRETVWVDFEDPALANTAVSTVVTSINNVDIVVERAMWWPGDSSAWHEAHASLGARGRARLWGLAEGQVGGATRDEDTYVLIANVDDEDGRAEVTLYFEDGTSVTRTFSLLARSRLNVHVRTEFPEAIGRRFGTVVASQAVEGGTEAPFIIVEQALYWNRGSQVFAAGSNQLGTTLQF